MQDIACSRVETGSEGFLLNSDRDATMMVDLPEMLQSQVYSNIRPILEDWSGVELEPTSLFGIRVYSHGTLLLNHKDREMLVVSAILNIDQDVNEPWPLEIEDHYFNRHEVFLEPGEMLLYEGARLSHGRSQPLNGSFYANLFVHFKPVS